VDGETGQRPSAEQLNHLVLDFEKEIVLAANPGSTREVEVRGLGLKAGSRDPETLRVDGVGEPENAVKSVECDHHIAAEVYFVDPLLVVMSVNVCLVKDNGIESELGTLERLGARHDFKHKISLAVNVQAKSEIPYRGHGG
jgi:hypothetical protein